jgi:hypothetical protein
VRLRGEPAATSHEWTRGAFLFGQSNLFWRVAPGVLVDGSTSPARTVTRDGFMWRWEETAKLLVRAADPSVMERMCRFPPDLADHPCPHLDATLWRVNPDA